EHPRRKQSEHCEHACTPESLPKQVEDDRADPFMSSAKGDGEDQFNRHLRHFSAARLLRLVEPAILRRCEAYRSITPGARSMRGRFVFQAGVCWRAPLSVLLSAQVRWCSELWVCLFPIFSRPLVGTAARFFSV